MKTLTTIQATRGELAKMRRAGRTIEFVPTMGAFHEGHLSLMREAGGGGGCVVVSIFVNPMQFGPSEDFDTYPRNLSGDLSAASGAGVDFVFAPPAEQMYPRGSPATQLQVGRIGEVGEGRFRPGHFAGVATVCMKLFNIVQPDRVYLGQKDAQQVAVIKQMVADLNLPVELVVCPTCRESDGLAMSSRNALLLPEDRAAAPVLYHALSVAKEMIEAGERSPVVVEEAARRVVARRTEVRLQYLEVVDPETFEPVRNISGTVTVAVAAVLGRVRLIDNVVVGTGRPA
jgi:pantoate--beta-alanine ligase